MFIVLRLAGRLEKNYRKDEKKNCRIFFGYIELVETNQEINANVL